MVSYAHDDRRYYTSRRGYVGCQSPHFASQYDGTLSPEMSPLGFTLAFDTLCPSGILIALTMPFASRAELNTLHKDIVIFKPSVGKVHTSMVVGLTSYRFMRQHPGSKSCRNARCICKVKTTMSCGGRLAVMMHTKQGECQPERGASDCFCNVMMVQAVAQVRLV